MSRILLITGSSGIAAATAKLAASPGDRVFFIGKSAEECELLTLQIEDSAFFVADVDDEEVVNRAFKSCFSGYGRVDALFNVAGLSGRLLGDGPIHQYSTAAWQP